MVGEYNNDRWYIDIRGEILGPISSWDIVQNLLAGKYKVVHRVSTDQLSWKAVCNEEYFADAVQKMLQTLTAEATRFSPDKKDQVDVSELSGFHNLGNLNEKINAQLEHANVLQEINSTMNGLRKLQAEMADKKKMVIEAKQEVRDELHPDDQNIYLTEKGTFFGPNLKKRLIMAAMVFVFIAGGLQALKLRGEAEKQKAIAVFKDIEQAQQAGDYDRVIAAMKGIKDTSPMDPAQLLNVIEVHVDRGQLVEAQGLLDGLDARLPEVGASLKARASNLQGLIASRSKNFDRAVKSFEQSIRESGDYYINLHNLAVLHLSLNNPEKAEPLFLKAVTMPENDVAPSLLGLYETALQLDLRAQAAAPSATKTFERLAKVESMFNEYFKNKPNSSYKEEMTVALISMAEKFNKPAEFKVLAEQFATMEIRSGVRKESHLGMDYQRTTWTHIYSWCLDIYQKDPRSALSNAFFGACMLRARGPADARPYIEYAANVEPDNMNFKKLLGML